MFNQEQVKIKSRDGSWKLAILNYDTYATDSSIHESLEHCVTNQEDEGTLNIIQYGSIIEQPHTKTGDVQI